MPDAAVLRGITWNHSRALPPLVAAAQRFEETHAGVRIQWDKRSLHEFGHAGPGPLCREYDVLVIDHPMLGNAARTGVLLELDDLVRPEFLRHLAANSAGASFESYRYAGQMWALPIDAAAPCASYRPDLLERGGFEAPRKWADVLQLARRGMVVMPGLPVDIFLNLMGLAVSRSCLFDGSSERLLEGDRATECLEQLRELASHMPEQIYGWNPIAMYEHLATSGEHAYCPFAYSYSNYARNGFAARLVRFANPARMDDGCRVRTILGGTGLAISSFCSEPRLAVEFASFCAGEDCQRTIYAFAGGQPAHRQAWLDPALNTLTNGFFNDTLECLDHAAVRPRYAGYTEFQAIAGRPVVEYVRNGGAVSGVMDTINRLYRESEPHR
jgi:multiple sugar transport system substrate-binding protein